MLYWNKPAIRYTKQTTFSVLWMVVLNMCWSSGSKKSLVGNAIFKITLLNIAKFSQPTAFYLFIAQVTRTTSGCLYAKFNLVMGLVQGGNCPCLWWRVFFLKKLILIKNLGMKFHARMKKKTKKTCKQFIPG